MDKIFTGDAYKCIRVVMYNDKKGYLIQIKDRYDGVYTVLIPDKDNWISKMLKERKRRGDVEYTDEYALSEKLLQMALQENGSLINVVIDAVKEVTEKRIRKEIATTLNQLLNP